MRTLSRGGMSVRLLTMLNNIISTIEVLNATSVVGTGASLAHQIIGTNLQAMPFLEKSQQKQNYARKTKLDMFVRYMEILMTIIMRTGTTTGTRLNMILENQVCHINIHFIEQCPLLLSLLNDFHIDNKKILYHLVPFELLLKMVGISHTQMD